MPSLATFSRISSCSSQLLIRPQRLFLIGVAQATVAAELLRISCAAEVTIETAAHAARSVAGCRHPGRKLARGDAVRVAAAWFAPDVGLGGACLKLSTGEEAGATPLYASPVDEQGIAGDGGVDVARVDIFERNIGDLAAYVQLLYPRAVHGIIERQTNGGADEVL